MIKKLLVAAVAVIAADQAQAVQIKSEQKSKLAAKNHVKSEAEWGFLKNIVNIDRFFDSGVKA